MRTLAEWLHVPIDWLRFGGDEGGSVPSVEGPVFKSAELKMISDLQLLDEHHQMMVREFIRILLHANGRKRASGKAADEMPTAEVAMR